MKGAARGDAWPALALRVAAAEGGLLLVVLASRGAGRWLPSALAVGLGFACAVGLPGAAMLHASGLSKRIDPIDYVALLPAAGLAAWSAPLLVALVIGVPFGLLVGVVLVLSAAILATSGIRMPERPSNVVWLLTAAVMTVVVASRWQPPFLTSDAFFHAGRVRKLLAVPHISFGDISAYRDGPIHAGYGFPLLHAVDAASLWLTGVSVSAGYLALVGPSAAVLGITYFAGGRALGGLTVGWSAAAFGLWDAVSNGGNSMLAMEQPATFVFHLLFPAFVLILVKAVRMPDERRWQGAAVACLIVIALVHPTYAVPALAIQAGATIWAGRGFRALAGSTIATAIIFATIWLVAIRGGAGTKHPPLAADYWIVSGHTLTLSGWWLADHQFAFLASTILMLAMLARNRLPWGLAAALMAGALILVALPLITLAVTAVLGYGQPRRFRSGIPWFYVAALGAAYAAGRLPRRLLLVAAVVVAACSIAVEHWQSFWSGWLTLPISVAAAAAAVLLVIARRGGERRFDPVAASASVVLTLLMVAALLAGELTSQAHQAARTFVHGLPAPSVRHQLTPGVIRWFDSHDSWPFPVVLAPTKGNKSDRYTGIAFQLIGEANVYAMALPEPRTRAEPRSQPKVRRSAASAFFHPSTSNAERQAILNRYQVRYVVVDLTRSTKVAATVAAMPFLKLVYADHSAARGYGQFRVYRFG